MLAKSFFLVLTFMAVTIPAFSAKKLGKKANSKIYAHLFQHTENQAKQAQAALNQLLAVLDRTIKLMQEPEARRILLTPPSRLNQRERQWLGSYWESFDSAEEEVRTIAIQFENTRFNELLYFQSATNNSNLVQQERETMHAISQKYLVFDDPLRDLLLISTRTHALLAVLKQSRSFEQLAGDLAGLRTYVSRAKRRFFIAQRFCAEASILQVNCAALLKNLP